MIGDMSSLSKMQDIRTRSVSPENFTGEKGAGGQATEGTGASCARDGKFRPLCRSSRDRHLLWLISKDRVW